MNYLLALCLLLLTPFSAHAQITTPSATISETKSVTSEKDASRSAVFTMELTRVMIRLDAAVFRVQKVSDLISSRFEKMTAAGVKNSRISRNLTTLTAQLTQLKTDYMKLTQQSNTMGMGTDAARVYPVFRKQYGVVVDDLKRIIALQKTIVVSFKPYDKPTVTPKPTVTLKPTVTPRPTVSKK